MVGHSQVLSFSKAAGISLTVPALILQEDPTFLPAAAVGSMLPPAVQANAPPPGENLFLECHRDHLPGINLFTKAKIPSFSMDPRQSA